MIIYLIIYIEITHAVTSGDPSNGNTNLESLSNMIIHNHDVARGMCRASNTLLSKFKPERGRLANIIDKKD